MPLETRGLLAAPRDGRLEIWGTTKVPHFNRRVLASMLGIPVERIRLHTADAGGGFGVRGEFYPEDFLVPWLAARTDRPVKWIEDRSEHLVATNHSRHQIHAIEAAFDDRHRLLAIADEVWHDNGAYIRTHGVVVADLTLSMLPGPYRVPAYRGTAHVVLTARTVRTYRGPGRYEATFARERLLDLAADELALDPLDLRRRNLLSPDELPLDRGLSAIGTTMTIDAGDVGGLLERTIAEAGFEAWRDESARQRARGGWSGPARPSSWRRAGSGPSSTPGWTCCRRGGPGHGGRHLSPGRRDRPRDPRRRTARPGSDDITVVLGDTDLVPEGVGSWASRSTVLGNAVALAADRVAELAREAAPRRSRWTRRSPDVGWSVRGRGSPDRAVSLAELGSAPVGLGQGDLRDRPDDVPVRGPSRPRRGRSRLGRRPDPRGTSSATRSGGAVILGPGGGPAGRRGGPGSPAPLEEFGTPTTASPSRPRWPTT